ncbi:MAG: hypothetical protein WA056_08405 [Gallionella sp.]
MNEHFPAFEAVQQSWVNVQSSDGSATEALAEIVGKYITADELLISINRKVGARLPTEAGIIYIASHMGKSQIRISNRDFTQFVLVASNCVATGTQIQANLTFNPDWRDKTAPAG